MRYLIEQVNLAPSQILLQFLPKVKQETKNNERPGQAKNKPKSFKLQRAKVKAREMNNGQMTTDVDNIPFMPTMATVLKVGSAANSTENPLGVAIEVGDRLFIDPSSGIKPFFIDPVEALAQRNSGNIFGTDLFLTSIHNITAWIKAEDAHRYAEAIEEEAAQAQADEVDKLFD